MNFITEIDNLIVRINSSSKSDAQMKSFLTEAKTLTKSFSPLSSNIIQELNMITTEPKGTYFPELYEKLKVESVSQCAHSLLIFLTKIKVEYDRLVINMPIDQILNHEESQYLEFKSTLCYDVKTSTLNTKLMGEIIMKAISAFSNSEGGVLLIGVKNDKQIIGLENDYKTFKGGSGGRDEFELHLTTLLVNNFSKVFAKDNLTIEFPVINKKDICLIRIKRGEYPLTVKISDKTGQLKEKFFIRVNNSSRDIENLLELARYIKQRFPSWN